VDDPSRPVFQFTQVFNVIKLSLVFRKNKLESLSLAKTVSLVWWYLVEKCPHVRVGS
jgi:hypothetical protein